MENLDFWCEMFSLTTLEAEENSFRRSLSNTSYNNKITCKADYIKYNVWMWVHVDWNKKMQNILEMKILIYIKIYLHTKLFHSFFFFFFFFLLVVEAVVVNSTNYHSFSWQAELTQLEAKLSQFEQVLENFLKFFIF